MHVLFIFDDAPVLYQFGQLFLYCLYIYITILILVKLNFEVFQSILLKVTIKKKKQNIF